MNRAVSGLGFFASRDSRSVAPLAGWFCVGEARLYRAKAYSDQELFIDTWWALFTLIQTALFVVKGGLVMVFSVCAFLAYWLIKRGMLKRAASAPAHTPRNLLLLRVFGHDARTERLLDDVGLRWRHLGTIQMIAGRDLAARNLDPHEFVAFLGGALAREFVKNEDDLRRRMAAMDRQPDVDGRYRVNQFFCHQNTWRAALNALVARSDAILMDLRGFDEKRLGCRYELEQLASHLGAKPIVFLTDKTTRGDLVRSIVSVAAHRGCGVMLDTGARRRRVIKPLFNLLLGAKPGVLTPGRRVRGLVELLGSQRRSALLPCYARSCVPSRSAS